jgi:uncharacterized membrane protein YtjA (UPF0391 family)
LNRRGNGAIARDGTPHATTPISSSVCCAHLPTLLEVVMLYYAIVFFVIALVAALFGFGGIAAGAAGIAKILFFAFLVIAIVTFLMSLARRT